jgi:hypothetical protein
MPANPRRLLELRRDPDVRRDVVVRRPDDARERLRLAPLLEREVGRRELRVDLFDAARDRVDRDFVERERLELDRRFLDRWDLVSPFSRRILLTVRAATSSARPP